jgi:enolase-phosphatase E1
MTKAVLLDIEGTTTPIDFVHKTLFPFAKERIGKYVAHHFDSLHNEIIQLVDEHSKDSGYTVPLDPTEPGSVSAYLEHLIDLDRKSTPLKSIQGKIWQQGYESHELRSVIFEDVAKAFERWRSENKKIAIYSSGSALAQKLIFKYSDHGDLSEFISDYFDTRVGHKREVKSYQTIARELDRDANDILFVSDIPEELDAARAAGMQTALSVRTGNAPIDGDPNHRVITTFDEI